MGSGCVDDVAEPGQDPGQPSGDLHLADAELLGDLALTELVPALGGQATNVHFEDRIEDGKITDTGQRIAVSGGPAAIGTAAVAR